MLRRLQHLSSFFQDVWDFYFMGWLRLARTVHGNGETTADRYVQFKDNQYYLLDTLDYHLRWGNYSAKNLQSRLHLAHIGVSGMAGPAKLI